MMDMQAERTILNHDLRIKWLEDRLKEVAQRMFMPKNSDGGGGETGGGAWAEAAAVSAGGSATLQVWETRSAGDVDMGERTVISRMNRASDPAGGNLILVKNPDGSYLLVSQSCPPEA